MTTVDGRLRLGLPTSPAIANLVAQRFDRRVEGMCAENGLRPPGRWIDDEIVSGRHADRFRGLLRRIAQQEGFAAHPQKGGAYYPGRSSPVVTGVELAPGPKLPDAKYDGLHADLDKLLAMPDALKHGGDWGAVCSYLGLPGRYCSHPWDWRRVRQRSQGKVDAASRVSRRLSARLRRRLARVEWPA